MKVEWYQIEYKCNLQDVDGCEMGGGKVWDGNESIGSIHTKANICQILHVLDLVFLNPNKFGLPILTAWHTILSSKVHIS